MEIKLELKYMSCHLYKINDNFYIIKRLEIDERLFKHLKVYLKFYFNLELLQDNNKITIDKYIDINLKNKIINVYNKNIFKIINFILKNNFFVLACYSNEYKPNFISYKNDNPEYYISLEIELDAPNNTTKKIIKNMKKFKHILYCTTENYNNCGFEINTYPTTIKILRNYFYIIDRMKKYGMYMSDRSDIHYHICSKYFGNNIEEKILNINKILLFLYNNDDEIKKIRKYYYDYMYIENASIKMFLEEQLIPYSSKYDLMGYIYKNYNNLIKEKNGIIMNPIFNICKFLDNNCLAKTIEIRAFRICENKEQFQKQINFVNTLLNIIKLPIEIVDKIKFYSE